jgi:stalled ribosome rescue protein Dom34
MSHAHAIVWMDAKEAHVFHFGADDIEKERIKAHSPFRKVHHKAGVIGAGHVHPDHHYFDEIAEALSGIQEWLLIGPGAAKTEMASYAEQRLPDLSRKLLGVQPADHPTDGELLAHARQAFRKADRLRPNSPMMRD